MAAKKPGAEKKSEKTKKIGNHTMKSFKVSRNDMPFLTFAITRQTLYWAIITVIVFVMGLWIIHLQNKVNEIYDTIQLNQAIYDTQMPKKLSR